MKFLRQEDGQLVFELRRSDRDVLGWLLGLYPVMPSGQSQVTRSKTLDKEGERQQLLEEALAAQRQENERRIQDFLGATHRFESQEGNFILRLTDVEADWLLEVLNEIRVGSWVRLGRPHKEDEASLPRRPGFLHHLRAMELSGYLQTRLLDGLTARQ